MHARLPVLDSLRGAAALLVVLVHVMGIAQVDPGNVFRWVGDYGGLAVPLFFSLSAFSLASGYAERLYSADALRQFFVQRFFRIAPLFYVCVALMCARVLLLHPETFSLAKLLLNLGFVFALSPADYESLVWAGWSLGVEALLYCLFPVLLLACQRWISASLLTVAVVVAGHFSFVAATSQGYAEHGYASKSVAFNLPYFVFGLLAWRLNSTQAAAPSLRRAAIPISLSLFFLLYQLSKHGAIGQLILANVHWWSAVHYYSWGILFTAIIYISARWGWWGLDTPLMRWLGVRAYGIYLLHPLAIWMLKSPIAWIYSLGLPASVAFFIATSLTLAFVLPLAALSWHWLEQPFIRWGKRWCADASPMPRGLINPAHP